MSSSSGASIPWRVYLPLGIGHETRERPRRGSDVDRLTDDAARHQIGAAVVVQREHLRRRAGGALEGDVHGRRVLVAAMAGAELPLLRGLGFWTGGRVGDAG